MHGLERGSGLWCTQLQLASHQAAHHLRADDLPLRELLLNPEEHLEQQRQLGLLVLRLARLRRLAPSLRQSSLSWDPFLTNCSPLSLEPWL